MRRARLVLASSTVALTRGAPVKLRPFGAVAALSLLAALTGCSTAAPGQPVHLVRTYSGTAVPQSNQASSDARPTVYWITGRRDAALTSYGSSSCPPVPGSIEVLSPTRISVHMKDYPGACTADAAATTSEFGLPSAVSRRQNVRVTLLASGMGATTLRLAPDPTVASHQG